MKKKKKDQERTLRVLVKSSFPVYRNISRIVESIGYEARHCHTYYELKETLLGSNYKSYNAILYHFLGFEERIPDVKQTVDIARELVKMTARTNFIGIYADSPDNYGLDMVLSLNGVTMLPYSSKEGSDFEELLIDYLDNEKIRKVS